MSCYGAMFTRWSHRPSQDLSLDLEAGIRWCPKLLARACQIDETYVKGRVFQVPTVRETPQSLNKAKWIISADMPILNLCHLVCSPVYTAAMADSII